LTGKLPAPYTVKNLFAETLQGWQRKYRNMELQAGDDILYTLYFAKNQIVIMVDKDGFKLHG
jgi:hypothetical protein